MMMEYSKIGMEGERTSKERPTQVRVLNNIKFECTSDSRILLHQNWCPGHIRSRISTFYIWLELEFHRASNGTGPPQNSFWVDRNRRHECASRIWQGAVSPSVGPLARVLCWSLLGLRPGDLHAPNSFLFSSCRHFKILGFCLDSICHQTVSPFISLWDSTS
jgi:hypothetical protein